MLDQTFMLQGDKANWLYNEFVKNAPIYDYHCHLSAKDISEDKIFTDITSLWLAHDHYKWRAMRYAGVPERLITGKADGMSKFKAWARTCERLIGSPLNHWANLELQTYFDIKDHLKEKNAEAIYHQCNKKIMEEELSPVKMIKASHVKLICTTDDPLDDLEYHKRLKKQENLDFTVLPTFRPDKALNMNADGFMNYLKQLSDITGIQIIDYPEFIKALKSRIEYFGKAGCRLSDHSLEALSYQPAAQEEIHQIFHNKLEGKSISKEDAEKFRFKTLILLAAEYKKVNWAMQLHIGAYRNTNSSMYQKLGVDAGFDIMNDFNIAEDLTLILNEMNNADGLPKTILYTLNSKDNLFLSSLPHCFPEDGIPGKIQFGPAWWFNDHKEGINAHLRSLANQGMLADFIGMLTDSRSFLSYVRHDYFRRILCSFLGTLLDHGELEQDEALLQTIIQGICYKNIIHYLALEGSL